MDSDILLIEKKENMATLTLNRPGKRNSLSPDLLIKIYLTLSDMSKDDQVRVVIIRGVGDRAFSSGYDIASIPTEISPEVQEQLKDKNPLELGISSVIDYPYPVIAMLNGYAFGAGCELALSCDIRIGADDIRMGMPPAKLGVVYFPDGLLRFIQVIGLSATKELFFSGRYYEAQRVKELGLVDYMVPRSELESFTYGLAEEIAGNAPLSLKGTKRILNLLMRTGGLDKEGLQESEELIFKAFKSEDLKEGQTAFLEKRKPNFVGR